MLKQADNYSSSETYSDFDESFFNETIPNSYSLGPEYSPSNKIGENELSGTEMLRLSVEHYLTNYISQSIYDKSSFFLLQAELFLNIRRYKDSLSACIIFDRLSSENIVSKCIKMICFYQLNYLKNFRLLKDEILMCNLDSLSESLRKNVIGTIQVSTWIPEFMNCISNMKSKK